MASQPGMRPRTPQSGTGGLTLTTTDFAGGLVVINAGGEVDLATGDDFRAGIEDVVARKPAALIIDLSGIDFFGSTGISTLVRTHQQAPCPVHVVTTPAIDRVLRVVHLQHTLTRHDTLADAVNHALDAIHRDPGDDPAPRS